MDDSSLTVFKAYSDSNWGACSLTSRSTMAYTFIPAFSAVSWLSKLCLHVTVSLRQAESFGLLPQRKRSIYCSSCLSLHRDAANWSSSLVSTKAPMHSHMLQLHKCTQCLSLTKCFVHEQVNQGKITVTYILTARRLLTS